MYMYEYMMVMLDGLLSECGECGSLKIFGYICNIEYYFFENLCCIVKWKKKKKKKWKFIVFKYLKLLKLINLW